MLVSFAHPHQLTPSLPPKKPPQFGEQTSAYSSSYMQQQQLPRPTAIPSQGCLLLLFVRSIQLEIRIFFYLRHTRF